MHTPLELLQPVRIIDVLAFLISKGPGRTESELAKAIYGPQGKQQAVNQDCSLLVGRGLVECRAADGEAYTYWPASAAS